MSSRIRLIVAAAAIFVLCRAAADHSRAAIIQDGSAGMGNPAIAIGGQTVSATGKRSMPALPYSLIGALRAEEAWVASYCGWSWRLFRSLHWHRDHPAAADGRGKRPAP